MADRTPPEHHNGEEQTPPDSGHETPPNKASGQTGSARAPLQPESLEPRILLSASWADPESGELIAGATEEADVFTGSDSDDVASALDGDDDLFGGAGNDRLAGGDGDDTIDGGTGTDTVDYASADSAVTVDITLSGAQDTGGAGTDTLTDIEGVIGSAHDDTFAFSAPAADAVYSVSGGEGFNTLDLSGFSADQVTLDLESGHATLDLGGGDSATVEFEGIARVRFSDSPETATPLTATSVIADENSDVTLFGLVEGGGDGAATVAWSQIGGPPVVLTDADGTSPSFQTPESVTNATFSFRMEVTDDGQTESTVVTVAMTGDNDPVALDLGNDLVVDERSPVQLNATAVDPEGMSFIYTWRQVDGPEVELRDSDTLSPSFDAPELFETTDIVFELEATDGNTTVTEQVTVTVIADDDPVVIDAGSTRQVEEDTDVTLSIGVDDPESATLTYTWLQLSGSPVQLDVTDAPTLSFHTPQDVSNSEMVFLVTVSDGNSSTSSTVGVIVNADNDAPEITEKPTQFVAENDTVTLGVTVEDPEDRPIAYTWEQVGGVPVTLNDPNAEHPTFSAPERLVNNWMTFQVTVSDGEHDVIDTVKVLVNADNDALTVDAGADLGSTEGEAVYLNALADDPEDQAVAYTWTQVGGPTVDLHRDGLSGTSFWAPAVDAPTSFTFQVSATDGSHTTVDTVTVTVDPDGAETPPTVPSDPPPPNPDGSGSGDGGAGDGEPGGGSTGGDLDVTVEPLVYADENEVVVLGATVESSDGAASFEWTQTSGDPVHLFGADTSVPSFVAPEHVDNAVYTFEVTVTDDSGTFTSMVQVVVNADNDTPTVDAGPDQVIEEDFEVQLDATGADDEDQHLRYHWLQTAGPPVELIGGGQSPRFVAPQLHEDTTLTFLVEVSDGTNVAYDTMSVLVTADNDAPLVNAGNDRTVDESTTVRLNPVVGDPEGDDLTYIWEQIAGPLVDLSDPGAPNPTFEAPEGIDGSTVRFRLTVSDGQRAVSDEVSITIVADNDPPIVDADPFQAVEEGDAVSLSASAVDPDSPDLVWTWEQIGGTPVVLQNADGPNPTFDAPEGLTNSLLRFRVTVSDGESTDSDVTTVQISADNDAPDNDAGADRLVLEDTQVTLTGSASDPEGQPLTHRWVQVSGPPVTLDAPTGMTPTFTAPNIESSTTITFELQTTDGTHTTTDTVTVTVAGVNDAPDAIDGSSNGNEDNSLQVRFSAADPDIDGGVTAVRIESLPSNGHLTLKGEPVAAGTVISVDDISAGRLVFIPDPDWAGTTAVTFSATDGNDWSDEPATQSLVIRAIADKPIVDAGTAGGDEDTAIPLSFSASTSDADGSEHIRFMRVRGAPVGSVFSDGVHSVTVTKTNRWITITNWDLDALTVTPADDHDQDFTLTLRSQSEEPTSRSRSTATDSVVVSINPIEDAPRPMSSVAVVQEDGVVSLMAQITEVDTGDAVEMVRIDSLPDDGMLFINGDAVAIGDTISFGDMTSGGLTFEPSEDYSGDAAFLFSAHDGELWSASSATFTISVDALADAPKVDTEVTSGAEDSAIPVDLTVATTDIDGSETITSVTIDGAPLGSVFSDGSNHATQGDAPIDLSGWNLDALTVTPPKDHDTSFELTVLATSEEPNGSSAQSIATTEIRVLGVNDAPYADDVTAVGAEDSPLTLRFEGHEVDTGDTVERYRVDTDPSHGTLFLDGVAISAGQIIDASQIDDGLLRFLPDPGFSGADSLTFSAFDGELWSAERATASVFINPVADAPSLTVSDAAGVEDGAIALDLSAAVNDPDASEEMRIKITGVPEGATLSAGTVDSSGTWTLTADQLDGLTITPAPDSDADFDLTVAVIVRESGSNMIDLDAATLDPYTGATPGTGIATVDAGEVVLKDAARSIAFDYDLTENTILEVQFRATTEGGDHQIGFDSDGDGTGDTLFSLFGTSQQGLSTDGYDDLGEWQTIRIPVGDLTTGEIDRLVLVSEGGTSGFRNIRVYESDLFVEKASVADTITVHVSAETDAPVLEVSDARGQEDTPIDLSVIGQLSDTDGSETLKIGISGVPDGATLSAGTQTGPGSWLLTSEELDGLTLLAPPDSDGDFTLTVTAVATESSTGVESVVQQTIDVTVDAVADTPALTTTDASGSEDSAISLSIGTSLADADGSESLAVRIAGVPDGATLSAGTDNGDGSWSLTPEQLVGLAITPGAHASDDFTLTVVSTSTEANGGDVAAQIDTILVRVSGVADTPVLSASSVDGTEDTPIALGIGAALIDTDGSETLSVVIRGVPAGATLSAGTDLGNGAWALGPDDLAGLTVTPSEHSDSDFTLSIEATATESDGDTAVSIASVRVGVSADADAPIVAAQNVSGIEDTPIPLVINAALSDADGSETLAIRIAGVPAGVTLSAGVDNADGTWTLSPDDLIGLSLNPNEHFSGSLNLTLVATSTEADGAETAQTSTPFTVTVTPDADRPSVGVADAAGGEDTPIALSLDARLVDNDGSETITIRVAGVPTGAILSAGTDNGDGTWSIGQDALAGLTITPPSHFAGDIGLTLEVTTTEPNGDSERVTSAFTVTVDAIADAPALVVADASGIEDLSIPLSVDAGLIDADGSETLAIVISGVPSGGSLSAGTDQGDGTWVLTADQLSDLTFAPPSDAHGTFDLTVHATATEGQNNDVATTQQTLRVIVDASADAPTLTLENASGTEDTPIALSIASALTDTDGSETLAISISGLPSDASLSAGVRSGDGTWSLTTDDLDGLSLTTGAHSDSDLSLTITAITTDANGSRAGVLGTLNVSVNADADAPTVSALDASGMEDTPIALTLGSALVDDDGSESLSLTLRNVPAGAALSAGTDNGDGTWTLGSDDLDDLTITAPNHFSGTMSLTLEASSSEAANGDTATSATSFNVVVSPDADDPLVGVASARGGEDTPIALTLNAALVDTDGSESIGLRLTGMPAGATLSAGTDNGDGTWSLTPTDLTGLTITAPEHFSGTIDLGFEVRATESDGSSAVRTGLFSVVVDPIADAPELTLSDASGHEDNPIALDIAAALVDQDGSESAIVTIADVPTGATLSAGIDNGDGTWTLTPVQLDGLTITAPTHSDDDFTLRVSASSTESSNGAFAARIRSLNVSVDPVADTPLLTLSDAAGVEDAPVTLDLSAALVDTDGSESIAVTIANVPDGASLSAGTDLGGGVWTLDADDLDGLTLSPGLHSDAAFTLTVSATATETGGNAAITAGTVEVTLDAVADAPTLTVTDTEAPEDTPVPISVSSDLVDRDGSETHSVVISGVPDGFDLSAGTDNGDGSWTLTRDDLTGLTMNTPTHFSGAITLDVVARTVEDANADTAERTGQITIVMRGLSDGAALVTPDSVGDEDSPIALGLSAALIDTDGSESITSVELVGVPAGATLSSGTDLGSGRWAIDPDDLAGLTLTPAAHMSGRIDLTLEVGTLDNDGATALTASGFAIDVTGVADAPTLAAFGSFTIEDTPVELRLGVTPADPSETVTIELSGLPAGTVLSAGTDLGDGAWALEPDDLFGLVLTPPEHYSGTLELLLTTTSTDGDDTVIASSPFEVYVVPAADMPMLVAQDAAGIEDSAIPLLIDSGPVDQDGSETATITVSGVPKGASLSSGTDLGAGVWRLTPDELAGLTIQPPADFGGSFDLDIVTRTVESGNGQSVSASTSVRVDVFARADEPSIITSHASGVEDETIPLLIDAVINDADQSEVLTLRLTGLPAGARLSDGTHVVESTGVLDSIDITHWSLETIAVLPAPESDTDFTLSVFSTSTERDNGSSATVFETIDVHVEASADQPRLVTGNASGEEDTDIPIRIDARLVDTDGSESLVVLLQSVPDGVTFSAGAQDAPGNWRVDASDLDGLSLRAPRDFGGDFSIKVTAVSTDSNGSQASTTVPMHVSITPVADSPTLAADAPASAPPTAPVPVHIESAATDADDSESLAVSIRGAPTGSSFSAGTPDDDGSWRLTEQDLSGLTLTPPDGYTGSIELEVEATSDDSGDRASRTSTVQIDIGRDEGATQTSSRDPDRTDGDSDAIDWGDELELEVIEQRTTNDGGAAHNDAFGDPIDHTPSADAGVPAFETPTPVGEVLPAMPRTPTELPPLDGVTRLYELDPATYTAAHTPTEDGPDRDPAIAPDGSDPDERDATAEGVPETARADSGFLPVLWGLVRALGLSRREEEDHDHTDPKQR